MYYKLNLPPVQDPALNRFRIQGTSVTVILKSGVQIKGKIEAFDLFVVVIRDQNQKQQMIYKHAISTILGGAPVIQEKKKEKETK